MFGQNHDPIKLKKKKKAKCRWVASVQGRADRAKHIMAFIINKVAGAAF